MGALLEFIFEWILEFLCDMFSGAGWRFWLSLGITVALLMFIWSAVADPASRQVLGWPVLIVGLGSALVWEWRRG